MEIIDTSGSTVLHHVRKKKYYYMDNELKQLRAVFGLLPSRHSPTELVNVFSLNRENVRKYFRTLKVRKYESTSGSTCVHVTFVRAHASRFEKVG